MQTRTMCEPSDTGPNRLWGRESIILKCRKKWGCKPCKSISTSWNDCSGKDYRTHCTYICTYLSYMSCKWLFMFMSIRALVLAFCKYKLYIFCIDLYLYKCILVMYEHMYIYKVIYILLILVFMYIFGLIYV